MKRLTKFFVALSLLFTGTLVACGGNGGSKDDGQMIDYVEKTHITENCALTTYSGVNFLDNGIGEVTLYNPVDGDTAHFYQKETTLSKERLVKVRFYGIDTPESTGQIEPWGKKASKFTTEKLQNAKTIVLTNGEMNAVAASADSTGTRFKALVWVSEKENAAIDELKCLNLWIVQEGYSNGKGVTGCPLADVFNKADLQAQKLKLHTWSGDDPDFYKGDALSTSIKDIVDEFVAQNGKCPTYEGVKVKINGVVAKVVDSDAYVVQDFENETTGEIERYGLFIFSGYKYYEALTTVGNDLTIIGTFTVRYGNPQLTSVKYNPYLPSSDDMVINSKGVSKPFDEMTISQVANKREYVNLVGTFKHLHASGTGKNQVDATTQVASGALTIGLVDDNGVKINLRVPKNVFLIEKDGGSLDRVTDYKYLYNNNLYFDLTAVIAVYDPASDDSDSSGDTASWQLTLCDKNDIKYY